jgi:hypothetical protein
MVLLSLLVGCSCGDEPASAPTDLGSDAALDAHGDPPVDASVDMDAAGPACGQTTCGAGERCCATCPGEADVCVPAAFECPVADEFDCEPIDCAAAMDVTAVGECDFILGYWWTGFTCEALSGCSCTGDVCDGLFTSQQACVAANDSCTLCGTVWGASCDEGEYCRHTGLVRRCERQPDHWGRCVPIPATCGLDFAPVCACDGNTYANPCLARAAQQTVQHVGACGG